MAAESKKVTIGENVYTITPFTAVKGMGYLKRILKIAGPALEELTSEEVNVGAVINSVINKFDEEPVEQLVMDLTKGVLCNSEPLIFDTHFQQNYGELIELVTEVIKLNYNSVFQVGALVEHLSQNQAP